MIIKTKKKRSSLSYQAIGVIVVGVVCLLLVGALIAVNYLTKITPFEIDGTTYYVHKETNEDGSVYYKLTDKDKNALTMTDDGYYVAASGALIRFDPSSGEVSKYAAVDTIGNEQVGINDRIIMFPYTERNQIQSISVNNSKGSYTFYRLRKYEDVDKAIYTCYLHNGKYFLIGEDGIEYKPDGDGNYLLPSGSVMKVDPITGAMQTVSYTDFDGKLYTVEKRANDTEYKLYLGDTALKETLVVTAEMSDNDGNPYTATLYSYAVTDYGTMIDVDGETGIISMQAVREYDSKSGKYNTYHFLCRNGKYVMCDGEGSIITETSASNSDYYCTKNNSYIAFNAENGSYSVIIRNSRKEFYLISDNDGVYSLYNNGKPVSTNSLGYCALPDGTYLYFDSESGSYSVLSYNGETYEATQSKYLNGKSFADYSGTFVISGKEETEYDPSLFAALVVSSGYSITAAGGKLANPVSLPSGEIDFLHYGLAEGMRTDASGKLYHHVPASYILTDLSGNVHKVTIGDAIASNGGYYVKYDGWNGESFEERQAVYIRIDTQSTGYSSTYEPFTYYTVSDTLLAPVENLITPMAVYPMQQNNYFEVKNFTIMTYNAERSLENLLNADPTDDDDYYDISVRFSYHNLSERLNTVNSSFPFVMETSELYGYVLDSDKAEECLIALKDLKFVGVSSLAADDKAMVKYGLSVPQYIIYYKSNIGSYGTETEQVLSISALSPNGTYYVYSSYYDMIVEVEKNKLPFLTWRSTEWLSDDVYYHSVGYCDVFTLEADGYKAEFDIDMTHTLETTINTTGSSNYTQIVTSTADRSTQTLTILASLGANLSSEYKAEAEIITVDLSTLRDYYVYVTQNGKLPDSSAAIKKLQQFMEDAIGTNESNGDGAFEIGGTYYTQASFGYSLSSGAFHSVVCVFSFTDDGEITAAVAANNDSPSLLFSMKAYEGYEKHMFSQEADEKELRYALDFYTASNVTANLTVEYEKVTATNSDGEKKVYSNEKIVTYLPDGTKSTDYCMTNNIKVFFGIEGSDDLIGLGTRWIRYYSVENGTSEYREIKDDTYTFKASFAQVVTVDESGNRVPLEGSMEGSYNVTIDANGATVTDADGNIVRKYLRYAGTSVFSGVYSGWLWATYEGVCDIPEEQKEAFRMSDDSTCQVKITVKTNTGEELVYRTYPYSERRSYITVNGKGDFFILRSFVDKVIDTSHLVFDNVYVDPDSKYND